MVKKLLKVMLLQSVRKLGRAGEFVHAKPGFVRNYLIPNRKACYASDDIIAEHKARLGDFETLDAKHKEDAQALASKLNGQTITLLANADPRSKSIYGSIGASEIAQAVNDQLNISINTDSIVMRVIKTLGEYEIEVAVYHEISAFIKVSIEIKM